MSSRGEIEQLQAEVDYYHDRVALLRAKLYRWGLADNARLKALERALGHAQAQLRDAQTARVAMRPPYRALWEQRLDALHTKVARGKRERRSTK